MISEGIEAPKFELQGSDGKTHTLQEFLGKTIVLYFYPKDDTPGCTTEAKNFNKSITEIRKLNAEVVGVSKDNFNSHKKFCSKYGLGFLLLSDPSGEMIKSYGAFGNRGIFGMGTLRNTIIIDKTGKVVKIFEKVKPDKHDAEVIAFLSSIS